jgi:SAM-dependent methyltransferase
MVSSPSPEYRSFKPVSVIGFALLLLSAATLAFEINLTRLFSVAQFYHFAFMVVSLALLGFGASGSILAIYPRLTQGSSSSTFSKLALATSATMLVAYLTTNWIPFDSFSIAWDRRQLVLLLFHYLLLVAPFFFSGLATSLLLTSYAHEASKVYAINLLGSSLGCLCALIFPPLLGGEGMVSLSAALAAFAASSLYIFHPEKPSSWSGQPLTSSIRHKTAKGLAGLLALIVLVFTWGDIGLRLAGKLGLAVMDIRLSPYKSLSYALQYPSAQVIYQRWNAFSRVDLVHSQGIRSLPGLSYRYLQPPPLEDGLLVDGDDLSPVVSQIEDLRFAEYLPAYLAFHLRPGAQALILEPRGGLDILTALAGKASSVTAVEINPLIVDAASSIYNAPRVQTIVDFDRSYLRRTDDHFDIILLSLVSSYHPVRSGAYSLAEDYRYTQESFQEILTHLKPGGMFVAMRWLQTPPSESLRVFALAVTALRAKGMDAPKQIVALRGYNTATFLIKNGVYNKPELETIRKFSSSRAFDLDYFPGISPEDVNLYNILPEPLDYQAYTALLNASSPEDFYNSYPFDIRPPTDDRPFFGHSFKWAQANQVIAEMGKTWQPFGGAGYFIVIVLLMLSVIASLTLILLPLAALRWRKATNSNIQAASPHIRVMPLIYFGLIGIAFLFVEIPLIQRFILYLGNPAFAMTAVLFSLLLFSGVGSQWSNRVPARLALGGLVLLLSVYPALLPALFHQTLGLSLGFKLVLGCLALAPIGFLMGIPFPTGVRLLSVWAHSEILIPWAWGVNGAASVVSSILAALLALNWGFNLVMYLGTACYAGAWLMASLLASLMASLMARPMASRSFPSPPTL